MLYLFFFIYCTAPSIRILKRSTDHGNNRDVSSKTLNKVLLTGSSSEALSIEEREKEYEKAKKRIFGSSHYSGEFI
jgi:sulfur relay (sulfurtransferase) DsrC/TusE family protein